MTEFRTEQLPKWKAMLEELFHGDIPLERVWFDPVEIVYVLDFIGRNKALNHTFFPTGGGLDLSGCSMSNEPGCIELDFGIGQIIKPAKLTFQWFSDAEHDWGYFYIESKELEPSGVYEKLSFPDEELVEIEPGQYIERSHWDSGEYYGERLPESARLVGRTLNGSFVTFSKAGIYNQVISTYDGRHSKVSAERFKEYIQEIVTGLKERS